MSTHRGRIVGALLLIAVPTLAAAQDFGGFSPPMRFSSGESSFLPVAPSIGGYIPYSPGPSGGLGVQGRMADAMPRSGAGAGVMPMPGSPPSILRPGRSAITPLTPIRASSAGMGMGPGGGLIPRVNSMPQQVRPPVGFYPFRQPGSLSAPGAAIMAM